MLRSGPSLAKAYKVRRLGQHYLTMVFCDSGWREQIHSSLRGIKKDDASNEIRINAVMLLCLKRPRS